VLEQGLPVFVKPVRLGSSVGVRKVKELGELHRAIDFALEFDTDVMIEKGVDRAREIFCAIYGDENNLKSSACGELRTVAGEFFDYNAKYIVAGGCETKVPADIPAEVAAHMRQDSENIFRALRGCGLARVGLFDGIKDGKYYFSRKTPLPVMSETSLFPQLFEACGEDYGLILERLIDLAREGARAGRRRCRCPGIMQTLITRFVGLNIWVKIFSYFCLFRFVCKLISGPARYFFGRRALAPARGFPGAVCVPGGVYVTARAVCVRIGRLAGLAGAFD
jgi:hypothetical protein